MAKSRLVVGVTDIASNFPDIVNHWDYKLNYPLTPLDVVFDDKNKYYWRCPKCCNLVFKTPRAYSKTSCLLCRKIEAGLDMLSKKPLFTARFWDSTANPGKIVGSVPARSNIPIQWRCKTCGGIWKMAPAFIRNQDGCPICAGKILCKGINDLKTLHPDICEEWDYERNIGKDPSDYLPNSKEQVWWKCKRCGVSRQTSIRRRIENPYCYCLNDTSRGVRNLATEAPLYVAKYWDYTKNSVVPVNVAAYSATEYWFRCSACGNSWKKKAQLVTDLQECPYCSTSAVSRKYVASGVNDIVTKHPEIKNFIKEWDTELNKKSPEEHYIMQDKVCWVCPDCNFHYMTSTEKRLRGDGCPDCRHSSGRTAVKKVLDKLGIEYEMNVGFRVNWAKGERVDFYIKGTGINRNSADVSLDMYDVAIEIDNMKHFEPKYGEDCFKKVANGDNMKTKACYEKNYHLLRIPYAPPKNYEYSKVVDYMEKYILFFLETHKVPKNIIEFYSKLKFSNYASYAKKQNKLIDFIMYGVDSKKK